MRQLFLSHTNECHKNQFQIYTDGSKTEDTASCSAVSLRGSRNLKLMPESSIFTAELCGILCGLQIVNAVNTNSFVLFCDSRSALQVVEHYDSTHPLISKIVTWLLRLERKGKYVQFCWCPSHVGITGNEKADQVARTAAVEDIQTCNDEIPYRDWYPIIKRKISERWSQQWQETRGNKLREIEDTIKLWNSSNSQNRKQDIILARLRIGHTKITHQFLMENRPPQYCEDCIVSLSVKHLLAECPSLEDIRLRLYPRTENGDPVNIMKTMLAERPDGSFDCDLLMTYLRQTELLNEVI